MQQGYKHLKKKCEFGKKKVRVWAIVFIKKRCEFGQKRCEIGQLKRCEFGQ